MPPTKAWKAAERRMAATFKSRRTPLSGGNSGHTRSDSLSPFFYLESKWSKRHAVWSLYDDTKEKARKERKPPAIVLFRKGSPGFIICLHSDDLQTFIQACIDSGVYQPPTSSPEGNESSGAPEPVEGV